MELINRRMNLQTFSLNLNKRDKKSKLMIRKMSNQRDKDSEMLFKMPKTYKQKVVLENK